QDTAIRMLGQWLTTDAAPALLELARTASSPQNQARALQGYLRIARDFDLPEPQRAEMCAAALRAAKRDEERKLALDIMVKHPSIDMLRAAVEAAKIPALKDDAGAAAMAMAQKVGGDSVDVRALLAQVGREPMKVEIVKAEYGAGATFKDVTAALARHARGFPLIVLPSPSYNASFGGDPVPGVVKQLKIKYRIDGKEGEVSLQEDAPVLLPVPK
ncbi:MAG TPA: PBS lyase, partial [Planctomycetes bacterium]|nr:PBS lyase [Planctomycetota bacterium]